VNLVKVRREYVDTPEGQVHYRTAGNGEPILLLHRAGLSSDQYTEMLPFLGKSYWAIAMDILGCGNTDLTPYEPRFDDYVRNIIHFLDALKIEKTNIVGFLLGSSLAAEIAATYPERVNKLVLWDCIYLENIALKKTYNQFHDKRMEFKDDGSHLVELWKSRLSQLPINLAMVQRSTVDYLRSGLGTRAEDVHRALFEYNIEVKLPKIKSQTLLLYGRQSHLFPRLEDTRKLIAKCETRIIEGAYSFPFWEQPEEVTQAIIQFLLNSTL